MYPHRVDRPVFERTWKFAPAVLSDAMAWLQITDSPPGDACPRCNRGELYVRGS
jgi:hypothetical protein